MHIKMNRREFFWYRWSIASMIVGRRRALKVVWKAYCADWRELASSYHDMTHHTH